MSIIKVNEIQDIGGNSMVTSDGSGNFTSNLGGGGGGMTWSSLSGNSATVSAGEGYFVDTTGVMYTSGQYNITLPSNPTAGDQIEVVHAGGNLGMGTILFYTGNNSIKFRNADVHNSNWLVQYPSHPNWIWISFVYTGTEWRTRLST